VGWWAARSNGSDIYRSAVSRMWSRWLGRVATEWAVGMASVCQVRIAAGATRRVGPLSLNPPIRFLG